MLNDSLNTELSKLNMAGAAINYSLDNNRFIISINGYSDKIIEVIRLAASNLVQNDFSNKRFESIKQDLQDTLENYKNKKLYDLAYSDAQFVLYPATFHPELALAALKSINLEEIIHIKNTILSSYVHESFIYGNVSQQEALGLQYAFFSSIPVNKNPNPVNIAKEPYIKLSQDKDYVWFVNPSNTDSNSIVTIYQASQIGYKARGMAALLAQLIQPEIYSQLRTKEQLGYVVGVAPQRHLDSTGLLFYIESPKAIPSYLLGRLENFLKEYQSTLTNMSQETFDVNKRSLIHTLRVRPKTFTTQSTDYINNIVDGQYEFNSQADIADILEKTTKEDVLKFYHDLLINHLSIRRLISSTPDKSFRNSPNKSVITDLKEFQKAAELY
jgi:insulysin